MLSGNRAEWRMLSTERADWRGGLMNYLGLVIALAIFVVIIVAYVQIITKAGYSPWWILLPLAMPVMYFVTFAVLLHDSLHQPFGTSGVTTLTNDFGFLGTIDLLVGLANFVMFLVFAFSEWPVMREARSRRPPAGRNDLRAAEARRPRRPDGLCCATACASVRGPATDGATRTGRDRNSRPVPPALSGPSAAPPEQPGEAAAGWYRSGALGKGEQSYWDGQTWTARRIWAPAPGRNCLCRISPRMARPAGRPGARPRARSRPLGRLEVQPAVGSYVRRGGLVTLPARMHEVHTWSRFGAPSTTARTRCTLGFQRRLVRRCEWLTFMPNEGFLPQISHTAAMGEPS